MRAFFVGIFLLFCGLFPILAQGKVDQSTDLGQARLRSEFHSQIDDPATLKLFMKSRGFNDLAELYYLSRLKDVEPEKFPEDLQAGSFELRRSLTERPQRIDLFFSKLSYWFGEFFSQPIAATAFLLRLIAQLLFVLFISSFLYFVIHLIYWKSAIARDFDRLFRAKGASAFFLSLAVIAIFAWSLHAFLIFVFLLSLVGLIYSAEKKPLIILCAAFCLAFNLIPIYRALDATFKEMEILEAINRGRVKLEYDPRALSQLQTEEKAIWALWNGAESEVRSHLTQISSPSLESELLKVQLEYSPTLAERARSQLLNLTKTYGERPILIFNLVQIDTQLQSLVAADEWRNKLAPEIIQDLNAKALQWERLLPPQAQISISRFFESFQKNFQFHYASLFTPWAFLIVFLIFGFKASGLCIFTGLATPQANEKLSRLASQYQEKADGMEPQARNRYLQEVRNFERRQHSLVRIFSWIFPSTSWLVHSQPIRAIALTAIPFLFLWFALPTTWRQVIETRMGVHPTEASLAQGISFSLFLVYLLSVFLIKKIGNKRMDA